MAKALRILIFGAPGDKKYLDELVTQLKPLQGEVEIWHRGLMIPGDVKKAEIQKRMERADVFLLLVSASFIASDEYERMLNFADDHQKRVVPVILRHCAWKETRLKKLKVLPSNEEPVKKWRDRERAWKEVVQALQMLTRSLLVPEGEGAPEREAAPEGEAEAAPTDDEVPEAGGKTAKFLHPGCKVLINLTLGVLASVLGALIVQSPAFERFFDQVRAARADRPPTDAEPGELWVSPSAVRLHYVPPLSFLMGSRRDEGNPDEEQRRVELTSGFWMMEEEVTQGLWARVHEDSQPAYFRTCGLRCPVERVNWFEALNFANTLSELEGLEPCYRLEKCKGTSGQGCEAEMKPNETPNITVCAGANQYRCEVFDAVRGVECEGYRLPTEAEWELAARADGEVLALEETAWCRNNSEESTHPVGKLEPNPWKLEDMLGNVSEWTWDLYSESPTGKKNPTGATRGSNRILRGGNWDTEVENCRSAFRDQSNPLVKYNRFGFRLVRTASE